MEVRKRFIVAFLSIIMSIILGICLVGYELIKVFSFGTIGSTYSFVTLIGLWLVSFLYLSNYIIFNKDSKNRIGSLVDKWKPTKRNKIVAVIISYIYFYLIICLVYWIAGLYTFDGTNATFLPTTLTCVGVLLLSVIITLARIEEVEGWEI